MTAITIEALGLSRDELAERILDKAVSEMLSMQTYDEDGEPFGSKNTAFANALQAKIKQRIDTAIDEIAAKNVLPNVGAYVESLVLQETTKWGAKVGQPVTFIEYLVQRAEAYMTEHVNYEGRSKSEAGGYSWSASQTRVAHMIHKHLHYEIESAMKQALADVNKSVAKGLHETVRISLNEAAAKLKVEVKS